MGLEKKKYHLVNWNQVCKPIDCAGLGIRPISVVNICWENGDGGWEINLKGCGIGH